MTTPTTSAAPSGTVGAVVVLCCDCRFLREPNRSDFDPTPLPRCGRTGATVRYDFGCLDGKHNADLERTARSGGTLQDFVGGNHPAERG